MSNNVMKIMVPLTSRRVSLSMSAFIRSSRCIYVFLSMLGTIVSLDVLLRVLSIAARRPASRGQAVWFGG
jgi:hypothetical protein